MKLSRILPIFLIVLVDVFGLTLVIPLLAIYAEHFHASPFQATLLVSVYAACQLVSGPLLGQISDRIGRKPMLLVSQLGTFIGFVVMARANALWMLYLARAIDGSTAGNLSLAQAYLSDNTEPRDRARAFGLIGIAFGLGFFVGPVVTANLVRYGLNAPIWAASGLSATSIVCTLALLPGGRPPQAEPPPLVSPANTKAESVPAPPTGTRLSILSWGAYARFFERPVLAALLAQFLFYMFAFSTFNSGFALFAERRFVFHGHVFGPREIGYVLAYVGFLGIVLQGGLIGRLVKRFGEPALVFTGFATLALADFVLGFTHTIGLLIAVSTLSSYGTGVLRPTLTSLVSRSAEKHEQGVVLGLTQSLSSVAAIFAPALAGVLLSRGSLYAWAWVAALAAGLGLIAARWGSGRILADGTAPPAQR